MEKDFDEKLYNEYLKGQKEAFEDLRQNLPTVDCKNKRKMILFL